MRALLTVAASLFLAHAVWGESHTVLVQETAVIEIAGATAAYTTNPGIADVISAGAGRISVTGHSAGTTQLIVVTAGGTQVYLIRVAAALRTAAAAPEQGTPQARYEGRYSSGGARIQNTLDVIRNDGPTRSELHLLHVHDLRAERDEPSDAIASVFYRRTTPGRELTLLDATVDVSRMTISNTQVRGLHLRQGALELHGGYASTSMYDGFFLPAERRWVAGAGYDFAVRSTRLTPSLYGFFSEPVGTEARRGFVGALTAEHRVGGTLFMRGEIGVSRSIAAAAELRHATSRSQLRAFFSFKPDDFPTVGLADIRGLHGELDWSRRATGRLSIASHGAFDRFNLASQPQTISSGSVGLRYALWTSKLARLEVLGGADLSTVRTPTSAIRTIGVPLGAAYEAPAFGLAASYRLLDHSAASRRGDALRVSGHAGRGRFNVNLWAERQRNAPTLALIFSAEPGLELALLRLGISVRNPEDVARALRDNAALIDLGFITGVNVDLTPRRLQAGFNFGWLGSGPRSNHFRLQAVYGRDEGIRSAHDSLLATFTYSRRVLSATDLYGSVSWWQSGPVTQMESGTSVEIGVRQQFAAGMPKFLRRSGTIEGFAFLDPNMRGVRDPTTAPLADIAMTLDSTRTTRTNISGAYSFDNVSPGPHSISAQLPTLPRAFFTTPSHAETEGPAHIDFGLVWAAARIDGRVVSDAGDGIAGAVLSATPHSGPPIGSTSDAEGRFVFAVPPGTFRIALAAQSLPPGYRIDGQGERDVTVEADDPQSVPFTVQALRSIAGRAAGASDVRIESLGRTAPVDSEGNFIFRSMPSGTFLLAARSGGRALSRSVTLNAEPVIMRDVDLASLSAPARPAPLGQHLVQHVVQAGAFREERNAGHLLRQLQSRGEAPFSVVAHGLTLVYIGPFETRRSALAARERLQRAGFDGFVRIR